MRHIPLLLVFAASLLHGCYSHKPRFDFDPAKVPAAPDYASLDSWAAHPAKQDAADLTPAPTVKNLQDEALIDVFFLHPTTLTGSKRGEARWNGDVRDAKLNRKTDESAIQYQASLFNGAGRVFAPRYRQGHLYSFFTKKRKASADKALALAQEDIKAAFRYYLEHENKGRPFIIAGHSQGGLQGMTLTRDLIEGTPLQERLAAAYFVGWPVKKDYFKQIRPCESPEETGCFCSWRTWERRYGHRKAFEKDVVCTNPLLWNTAEGRYADRALNKGAVLRNFNVVYPQLADAEVYKGILLCKKPKFPGSFLLVKRNYHIADLNFYYFNVRENAQMRAEAFMKR